MNSNIYDIFQINSASNTRVLIVGQSGGGKTQIAFQLIFNMPEIYSKLKRIIFIYGGFCRLKEELIPKLKKANIDIEEIFVQTKEDLDKINIADFGYGDLVFIDDLSAELSTRAKILVNFLNKAFTTSRNQLYDIISIFHSFKLFNTMMRNNANLIIFTNPNQDIKREFKDFIEEDIDPLVFDASRQCKQMKYLATGINSADEILQRLEIKDKGKFPIIKKKDYKPLLLNIKSNSESYLKEINPKYLNFIKSNSGIISPHKKKKEIEEIIEPIKEERKLINEGEQKLGNQNVNKKFSSRKHK